MERVYVDPALAAGLVTAFGDFVAEHGIALTRLAYMLCGDRGLAEDLVQDTYLAMYRRFGNELTLDSPAAYARRAIANANISRLRRRAAGETVMSELPDRATDSAFSEAQDAMWRALRVLPERQRAVLVLRYYADLTDADIASTLNCREGTVRSLAARAFASLRTSLRIVEHEQ